MDQSKVIPDEERVKRAGYRLGHIAALTTQRLKGAIFSLRGGMLQTDQSQITQEEVPQAEAQPVMERAETLIDQVGQRLSLMTTFGGLRIQQATAYVREGIEDMWAEAQHISHQGSNKSE